MPKMNPNALSGPVPGMGLTSELGSRPWQRPTEYATLDEVVPYYLAALENKKFINMFLDSLESGVPVTALVDIMVQTSVMEGKHTIDVGILISPIMVEALLMLAERSGIDYVSGLEEDEDEKMSMASMKAILDKAFGSPAVTEEQLSAREEITEAATAAGKGLMAKRGGE